LSYVGHDDEFVFVDISFISISKYAFANIFPVGTHIGSYNLRV